MHHYGTNVCGDGGVALLDAGGALLKLLVKFQGQLAGACNACLHKYNPRD